MKKSTIISKEDEMTDINLKQNNYEKTVQKRNSIDHGITLIALIVTIIVLLILIGVTVHLTVNGKGIFYHAKRAAFVHDMKSYQEQAEMYIAGESLEAKDKKCRNGKYKCRACRKWTKKYRRCEYI